MIATALLVGASHNQAAEQNVGYKPRLFPGNRLFLRRLADPGETQLSARYLANRGEFAGNIGYSVGIVEFRARTFKVQFLVEGNTFLVSKLSTPDFPVQSTDYTIAFALAARRDNFSARLKWMHISSHLGDDFNAIEDVSESIEVVYAGGFGFLRAKKFSREFIELQGSVVMSGLRVYGGPVWAYHIVAGRDDPVVSDAWTMQAGLELRKQGSQFLRPFLAADFKARQEFSWDVDYNFQAGVALGKHRERQMRIAVEFFGGHSPQGQFQHRRERDLNLLTAFDF